MERRTDWGLELSGWGDLHGHVNPLTRSRKKNAARLDMEIRSRAEAHRLGPQVGYAFPTMDAVPPDAFPTTRTGGGLPLRC